MCPCGGELTVWCHVHGDWVCDDCGCPDCREDERLEAIATGADPEDVL